MISSNRLSVLESFPSTPILCLLVIQLQFVVEVDTLDMGSPEGEKLHSFAFLSWKLSSAERNYDVGNNKLLAVKVALEEW